MTLDLEPARAVLAADGVDLTVVEVTGGVAHLGLVVTDADCAECVLPRELLEPVVLELLRATNPQLEMVRIADPREARGASMTTETVWGTIDGREITFPMVVPDFNGLTMMYTVPATAAQALLPGDAFEVLELTPGEAQLVVAACDYIDNPWGDYNELNLGFLVRPRGAADDVMGSFVFRMPVDQAFTCEAGNRVMGFPKTVEDLSFTYTEDRVRFELAVEGTPSITIEAPRPAEATPGEIVSSTSYSYLDDRAYGTQLDMTMGTGMIDPAQVHLELGAGLFADELRTLGLPFAPDVALWSEHLSATFHLGQPVL